MRLRNHGRRVIVGSVMAGLSGVGMTPAPAYAAEGPNIALDKSATAGHGCRVPLPWKADAPSYGFGAGTETWLQQPADRARYAVDRQTADPGSMLSLYRTALRIRRTETGVGDGPLTWLPSPDGLLTFTRAENVLRVANLSAGPVPLPSHNDVLLASEELAADRTLPSDTAVWLRT